MNEEESIATYFLHVDDIFSTIRGFGEEINETIIVQKVLRTIPSRFNPKISSIKELNNVDKLTMDELNGILTKYEIGIEHDKPTKLSRKEESFKESKKINTKEYKMSDSSENKLDEKEAKFLKKLNRGTRKYKCKLPFKLFNCGEVGNFSSKCPYANNGNINVKEDWVSRKR